MSGAVALLSCMPLCHLLRTSSSSQFAFFHTETYGCGVDTGHTS